MQAEAAEQGDRTHIFFLVLVVTFLGVRCGLMGISPNAPPSVFSHPSGTMAGGMAVGLYSGISWMFSSPPAALIAAAALACAVPGRAACRSPVLGRACPVPGRDAAVPGRDAAVPGRDAAVPGRDAAVSGRSWSYCQRPTPTPPPKRQHRLQQSREILRMGRPSCTPDTPIKAM